eukprot:783754-Prymnesium_polylepis.1
MPRPARRTLQAKERRASASSSRSTWAGRAVCCRVAPADAVEIHPRASSCTPRTRGRRRRQP